MRESLKINDETTLQNTQRRQWNDVFRLWKSRLFGKLNQNHFKKETCAKVNKMNSDDSKILNIAENNTVKLDSDDSIVNNLVQDQHLQLCNLDKYKFSHIELSNAKPTMQKKIIQFVRRKKTEELLNIQEKQITTQNLFEKMELARKQSNERIIRAKNYYKKLQSYVRLCALNEIVEYIINNFEEESIKLLLECVSDVNSNNSSFNSELYEIYLQTKFRICNSEKILNKEPTTEQISENSDLHMKENDSNFKENTLDTYKISKETNELKESLLLLESTYSNFQSATEYLVSRVCEVSMNINKTVIDCLKKEIFDLKTGKYLGGNRKFV